MIIVKQASVALFRGEQCVLRSAFFRLIAENQHDAGQRAAGIEDGRAAVGDGRVASVFGDEHGVVRQPDDDPFARDLARRILDRLARLLVDDVKDFFQRLTARLVQRPAGEFLRHRVEQFDAPFDIGHNGAVADAEQYGVVARFACLPRFLSLEEFQVVKLFVSLP